MEEKTSHRNIFIASFFTLIAAGVGFGIRGGILADWSQQFGFTKTDLGTITGGGLVGFGVTIIICSIFADRLGYRRILIGAFLLHVLSAIVTLAATPIYNSLSPSAQLTTEQAEKLHSVEDSVTNGESLYISGKLTESAAALQQAQKPLAELAQKKELARQLFPIASRLSILHDNLAGKSVQISPLDPAINSVIEAMASAKNAAYWCLYIGMFMFALANGLCEAVINPLVATLYSTKKTHYLNILHAGWPAGLVLGGLAAYGFAGNNAAISHVRWEILMVLFLLPTLFYGFVTLKETFPQSEARKAGITFGVMLAQFAAPLLLLLLLIHAMVGYVELGTDSWITNITGNVIAEKAFLLFIYTSSVMFILRFFAGPIVERINPLGLLFFSAILGAVGLTLLGIGTTVAFMFMAATVYALGKTFFWPTMLGVAGERFPKGGALTMGTMGGIGMLSAGLLGTPGIGYNQDYFASKNLKEESPLTFDRYVSPEKNHFLFFPEISGLDGKKVGNLEERVKVADEAEKKLAAEKDLVKKAELDKLLLTPEQESDKKYVLGAQMYGGRWALRCTAAVPATMAVLYLCLVAYFAMKGGYKAVHISEVTGPTEY